MKEKFLVCITLLEHLHTPRDLRQKTE